MNRDQVATGGRNGWGAVPGRLHATVPAALVAEVETGAVEPAADPAESCPYGSGVKFPVPNTPVLHR